MGACGSGTACVAACAAGTSLVRRTGGASSDVCIGLILKTGHEAGAVSYTHLTLPTICSV
eukprot:14252491-Alexandrium_andersonii.AAC.1